ncbi:MAG: NrpR regulatory domain-containing protein [Methanosphaera sp.]|nr:NrpR regulatory domain-containing protein [Methanosphaera sp.]
MKMMEILRILYSKNEILGAKVISEELKKRGYSLGERAVRYHMHILDERGLTEKVGYKGRKITDEGIEELKKGLIYDQVDFTYSHFQEKMYNVDLDPETGKGSVIVNISSINELDSTALINKMFEKGLSVSNRYHIYEHENKTYIETVCGTTIDGVLQHNGIISKLMYGGLLKVEDYVPINFTEQIAYSKTSITPLEAFTSSDNTSILDVVTSGTGVIPANFRIIPAVKKEQTIKLLQKLNKININGVITIGEPGKPVLGIPVPEGMTGIAIIGGVTPLCAAQEAGYDLSVKLADSYSEYSKMVSSSHEMKTPLKPATAKNNHQISFILNKISNLISQVNFDEETCEGEVITNISYIDREYLDESLEILNKVYKSKPEYCIGNRYSIIDYPDNKVGLGTICSLTVDGILINKGITVTPGYSGVLDVYGNNRRFIELISYMGSSIDPHEIFLKKNMEDILGSLNNSGKILASVHSIPYIARDKTISVLESLKESGFEVLKLGKPNEYMYNARIEKYNFGFVLSGGLNPIAAIKEKDIPVDIKSIETIVDFNSFEEL